MAGRARARREAAKTCRARCVDASPVSANRKRRRGASPRPARASIFPLCAPRMARDRAARASGSNAAKRRTAAADWCVLNVSSPPQAKTGGKIRTNRRARAMGAASRPSAKTTTANRLARRAAPAGRRRGSRRGKIARPSQGMNQINNADSGLRDRKNPPVSALAKRDQAGRKRVQTTMRSRGAIAMARETGRETRSRRTANMRQGASMNARARPSLMAQDHLRQNQAYFPASRRGVRRQPPRGREMPEAPQACARRTSARAARQADPRAPEKGVLAINIDS